jgi:pyridoxamine 5'-phosphate oxidase
MKKAFSIAHLRREYRHRGLLEKDAPRNPFPLFEKWFKEALKARVLDANAMAVTTVSSSGKPSVRMVLLKGYDSKGFVFYTNYQSHKGRDLSGKPVASLLFFWPQLSRQIRIDGKVQRVPEWESDEYFQIRPRGGQLGAWASDQSRIVKNREVLEKRMRDLELKYKGQAIPRPSHWGGYRVVPSLIEFWKGRPNRLHDRLVYRRKGSGGWKMERLAP